MMQIFKNKYLIIASRSYSNIAVCLDTELLQKLEKKEIKPKKHIGIEKYVELTVPEQIKKSIIKLVGDYPLRTLVKDGEKLSRYIASRHPPAEQHFIQYKKNQVKEEINKIFSEKTDELYKTDDVQIKNNINNKSQKMLKERIYAWKPINYGKYESLVYAISRSSLEFTILTRIFNEIKKFDCDFEPRSFFDFGSGVGTGMWAVSNVWKNSIFEYFNVDSSRDMNDLADLILRGGNENQQSNLKNVYFRQFLPSKNTQFDLIISSFSLFELNSKKSRMDVLHNLWMKCANYLVIVEEGSRSGFNLINEARDFLLNLKDSDLNGYIFSPCPHSYICPRFSSEQDKTPCNFEIQYQPLSILRNHNSKSSHLYSYIVLKKGVKPNTNSLNWPRIVRPSMVRARHTICRLCTNNGELEEIIFTASKHGKFTYQCAKSSKWGDRLPIQIEKEKSL